MPSCVICTSTLTKKSPGIQCTVCRHFYHANGRCSAITKNQLPVIFNLPGGRWACLKCRGQEPVPAGSSGQSTDEMALDDTDDVDQDDSDGVDIVQVVKSFKRDMAALRSDIKELKASVIFCSNKVTDFEIKLSKFNELVNTTNQLKSENTVLKKDVLNLSSRINALEQDARSSNVEIMDIPQKTSENLVNIVRQIGAFLDHQVSVEEIESVVRVPTRLENKPKNIVLKFKCKTKRNEFLAAVKRKRLGLNGVSGFSIDGLSSKFYVNEHLTTRNKILLKSTRLAAKEKGYKYVWSQNGNVLIRKTDNSGIIQIHSDSDLVKIK